MALTETTIRTKDYQSRSLARVVRGTLYQHDPSHVAHALYLLASGSPDNAVIIASTVKLHNYFEIEMPHKDCKAEHKHPEPKWYTSIIARAFPDVAPEHRDVVRLLGQDRNVVRVPIIEPLEVSWRDDVS